MRSIVYRIVLLSICTAVSIAINGAPVRDVVEIKNCTNYVLYGAIFPAELSLMHRHMQLHESYKSVQVWVIPPFKTAIMVLPPRALTSYDRDLWITHLIDDMKEVLQTKSRQGKDTILSFNIGSSKAKRYIGIKNNRLAVFTTQNAAERSINLSAKSKQNAQSQSRAAQGYTVQNFAQVSADPLPQERYLLPNDSGESSAGSVVQDFATAVRRLKDNHAK